MMMVAPLLSSARRCVLALSITVLCCLRAGAEDVTIFAAASLKTALDEMADDIAQATGHDLSLSYAGTSVLARQVAQGAPADVIITASRDWMDWLARERAIDTGTRVDLARNRIVLVGHAQQQVVAPPRALPALLGQDRVAMALVDAVPAGIYGKAALTHFDVWDQVAPNVVQTDNVRAALALVAAGAVPFGVVYATDVQAEPRVHPVFAFPGESHPPVVYAAALVQDRDTAAARSVLNYLRSDAAQSLLARHGFAP